MNVNTWRKFVENTKVGNERDERGQIKATELRRRMGYDTTMGVFRKCSHRKTTDHDSVSLYTEVHQENKNDQKGQIIGRYNVE